MGLLSSSSRRTTEQYDQRQVNDASGGRGIAGNSGTVNITDGSGALVPILSDGLALGREAQRQALDLARKAVEAGAGSKTSTAALWVAGLALVAVAFMRPR